VDECKPLITGWSTPELTTSSDMFNDATSWLAKFEHNGFANNGPPSNWALKE
jgi:hypothetical protein